MHLHQLVRNHIFKLNIQFDISSSKHFLFLRVEQYVKTSNIAWNNNSIRFKISLKHFHFLNNRASAAAIGYLTPALVTAINFYSFLFFAGFCVLAFFYGWFVPESAGFPSEKIFTSKFSCKQVRVEQCLYTSIVPRNLKRARGTMFVFKHCSTRPSFNAWNNVQKQALFYA